MGFLVMTKKAAPVTGQTTQTLTRVLFHLKPEAGARAKIKIGDATEMCFLQIRSHLSAPSGGRLRLYSEIASSLIVSNRLFSPSADARSCFYSAGDEWA